MLKSMLACSRTNQGVTPRDGLIGGAVMIGSTLLLSLFGIVARRAGWPVAGEVVKSLAFTVPFTLSMPFWLMKGHPRRAQAVIIGGTTLILVAAALFATRI